MWHLVLSGADGKYSCPCLFEVQHHVGRVLQVLPPQVGEATHGGSVYDAMICRPADVHDVSSDHLTTGVKPGEDLTAK